MKVLFLGEESGRSAEYLREAMISLKHKVDHIDCFQKTPKIRKDYDVYLISDFPAKYLKSFISEQITEKIFEGKRFVMIGGWASFNGKGNGYYGHKLSSLLPVTLSNKDDRLNYSQGLMLSRGETIDSFGLFWKKPPVICGYNQAKKTKDAQVLVWMNPIDYNGETFQFKKSIPLVLKKKIGQGTSIACLTDLSPHWCGGLVDWGRKRILFKKTEVGDSYVRFIDLLLRG